MFSDGMVASAIADRFGRWGEFLRQVRATPLIVVGLTQGGGFVVTACEGVSDEEVAEALIAAGLMCAGRCEGVSEVEVSEALIAAGLMRAGRVAKFPAAADGA